MACGAPSSTHVGGATGSESVHSNLGEHVHDVFEIGDPPLDRFCQPHELSISTFWRESSQSAGTNFSKRANRSSVTLKDHKEKPWQESIYQSIRYAFGHVNLFTEIHALRNGRRLSSRTASSAFRPTLSWRGVHVSRLSCPFAVWRSCLRRKRT